MCGIFGIINQLDQAVPEQSIARALQMLKHRGPDGEGIHNGSNFAFGHRRLAIFDISEKGNQPMCYGDLVIVFNGAIYNFPELKAELRRLNYHFTTETDTEVILAAYQQWGTSCVNRFNGQWAFAIYDNAKKIIFCSRDRFGIKPFYYSSFGNQFHFASEIKAFFHLPTWERKLNHVRTYEYLVYGLHNHTSETLYEGVHQLPQASSLIYDLRTHSYRIERYYDVEEQILDVPNRFEEARDQFSDLFKNAVDLRMRADVTTGAALSGGLDSSSVVCLMNDLSRKERLKTISVCYPDHPKIDETVYVDQLQQKLNFESIRINPEANSFTKYEARVSWHHDEPLSGPGMIAQFLVFQQARQAGIKVMLDGQGGDEILGGYDKFYAPYFKSLFKKNPLGVLPPLWYFFFLHHWSFSHILKKMMALQAKTKGLVPAWVHPNFQPDPEQLYRPTAARNVRELSLQFIRGMGLPALLHYEDRNAMAHGVESRLPFLDHRLVEFSLSLPAAHKIYRAQRKYILREAMQPFLPESIYRRYDKLGFEVPKWTPGEDQFKKEAHYMQFSGEPILDQRLDWTKLPLPIRHRIHYCALFLKQDLY